MWRLIVQTIEFHHSILDVYERRGNILGQRVNCWLNTCCDPQSSDLSDVGAAKAWVPRMEMGHFMPWALFQWLWATSYWRDIFGESTVERIKRAPGSSIVYKRGIPIITTTQTTPCVTSLSKLSFKPLNELVLHRVQKSHLDLNVVWHCSCFFTDGQNPSPNWSGYMHDVTVAHDEFNRPAVIRMLPILNLNPNDRNCIYIYMETALITFDQPLWVKAVEVVVEQQINVVSIWVLHATISCLSSVGIIMSGSAIEKALGTCFGSLTVGHILSGKCLLSQHCIVCCFTTCWHCQKNLQLLSNCLWLQLTRPIYQLCATKFRISYSADSRW